jgi:DNA-binding ferritin-like protein (Dps family)
MFSNIGVKEFQEYLDIEKERQLALKELSEILGIDITFSDEEMVKNAEENFVNAINKKISNGVNEWMKSVFS